MQPPWVCAAAAKSRTERASRRDDELERLAPVLLRRRRCTPRIKGRAGDALCVGAPGTLARSAKQGPAENEALSAVRRSPVGCVRPVSVSPDVLRRPEHRRRPVNRECPSRASVPLTGALSRAKRLPGLPPGASPLDGALQAVPGEVPLGPFLWVTAHDAAVSLRLAVAVHACVASNTRHHQVNVSRADRQGDGRSLRVGPASFTEAGGLGTVAEGRALTGSLTTPSSLRSRKGKTLTDKG